MKCHAVGIVKELLHEEVLSVSCFLQWMECSKKKKDLNHFLLHWITFGWHKICSEILIHCLLANTYYFFFYLNYVLKRSASLPGVRAAEMLDIKEMAKRKTMFSEKHPVLWQNFLCYLKNLKPGHENWMLTSDCNDLERFSIRSYLAILSFKCKMQGFSQILNAKCEAFLIQRVSGNKNKICFLK